MTSDKSQSFASVREIGLAFPRATETRYYRMPALAVDGEVFAVQTGHRSAEPNTVSIPVGFKRRDELIAADPDVFYLKQHYAPYPVVLVRLHGISRENLQQLLQSAYEAVSSGSVQAGQKRGTPTQKAAAKIVRRKRRR